MPRHVFYLNTLRPEPGIVAKAERTAKVLGATVVRKAAGAMLLEATPGVVTKVAKALPGWRHSPEQSGYRVPEKRPLQRAKLAASSKGG